MGLIWSNGEGKTVSAIEASGGLLTWWDKNCFRLRSSFESHHWLFVELEDINNKEFFWVGNVYGPANHGNKE